jgi:hypothetical protein
LIEVVNLVHHLFDGEIFADELLAALAELGAEFWVAGEEEQALGDGVNVADADEVTGLAVEADFVGPVEIVGDHRFGGSEGLWQCTRQSFTIGQVGEAIHDADVAGDFVRRDETIEGDFADEAEFADAGFELRTQEAVADKEDVGLWAIGQDALQRGEEVVVAFERKEAGDFADDEGFGGNSQFCSERSIVAGVQEGFELEATEDAGVHLGAANAGSEVQFGHGVRGANEVRGEFGGVAFGGGEDVVGKRALEIAEGGAVNVMDDDGNSGARGGDAAEYAGFAAVGVDKAGFLFTQQARELAQGKKIFPRMDRANEGRNNGEQAGWFGDFGFQRTFGAGGGAGNQMDGDVRFIAQAEDGGDGVFLGATDNEPGDDVGDAHGVVIWAEAQPRWWPEV